MKTLIVAILIFLDAIFLSLSWFGAYWLRFALGFAFPKVINPFDVYLYSTPLMVSAWIFTCAFFGLYHRVNQLTVMSEFMALLKVFLLGLLVSMSISFLFKDFSFGRSVVIFMGALSLVFLSLSRFIVRVVERRLWKRGYGAVRTLVVGTGTSGIRVMQKLQDSTDVGYEVIGFIDETKKKRGRKIDGVPVLGGQEDINAIVLKYMIDDVFFALPHIDHNRILNIVSSCPKKDVTFHIVTDVFDVLSDGTKVEMLGDFSVVGLKGERLTFGYENIKRLMDLSLALFGLLLALPFWILIFLAIALDSRGPILFRQKRVGKDGKEFDILKFRTMFSESANYEKSPKNSDDRRITRVGKILRRYSLDELPQLINVIGGDMSVVGPRPEMPFIVEKYQEWEKKRLLVKPGITGLWQVLGRKDLPLEENIQYDFFYIKNRSLLMDISIILRTIPILFSRRGAY